MNTKLFVLILGFSIGAAAAAEGQGQPDWRACVALYKDNDSLLAKCIRAAEENVTKEEFAATKPPVPIPEWTVKVRNSIIATTDFGQYDLGTKGASWSLVREKGAQVNNASIGVFAFRVPFKWDLKSRFQPFAGAAVTKSGTGTTEKDIRDLTVGVTGIAFQRPESGRLTGSDAITLLHTGQYIRREDERGASEGHILRVHGDVVWAPLASGKWLWFGIVPQAGLLWERRTGGGLEDGRWDAVYAGFVASKKVGQVQGSLVGRWLRDLRVPARNAKRSDDFVSVSVDYYLYDPENESASFQPSLYITRQVGNDFLTGAASANKTEAGVRLKFN